jgi:hypothetical protein
MNGSNLSGISSLDVFEEALAEGIPTSKDRTNEGGEVEKNNKKQLYNKKIHCQR